MSTLTFDGDENSLALFTEDGKLGGGPWQASNRGVRPNAKARDQSWIQYLPDGTYDFKDRRASHKHTDQPKLDMREGTYGRFGILRLKDLTFRGIVHKGVGIHAGRVGIFHGHHGHGPHHVTHGCIRTTEAAMRAICGLIIVDPLTKLKVTSNGKHPQQHGA